MTIDFSTPSTGHAHSIDSVLAHLAAALPRFAFTVSATPQADYLATVTEAGREVAVGRAGCPYSALNSILAGASRFGQVMASDRQRTVTKLSKEEQTAAKAAWRYCAEEAE